MCDVRQSFMIGGTLDRYFCRLPTVPDRAADLMGLGKTHREFRRPRGGLPLTLLFFPRSQALVEGHAPARGHAPRQHVLI